MGFRNLGECRRLYPHYTSGGELNGKGGNGNLAKRYMGGCRDTCAYHGPRFLVENWCRVT